MNRNEQIKQVIELEWQMFTTVRNQGERASCQDDRSTFEIMRLSQFQVWSGEALLSYRNDLTEAAAAGKNLLAEKYGYMMRDTCPQEYERIRGQLTPVTEEKAALVAELTAAQVRWMADIGRRYPDFAATARPVRREDARGGDTSVETYAMGELSTYSVRTLKLLRQQYERLEREEENPGIRIVDYTARCYGYASVQDVQDRLAAQRAGAEKQINR